MTDRRQALGRAGEERAARWYLDAGYRILERNWRVRDGEIDVIALSADGTLVVCEVKTRSSDRYGTGADAVDARKQRRLRTLAIVYLRWREEQGLSRPRRVRFDVAVVSASGLQVIEAAF